MSTKHTPGPWNYAGPSDIGRDTYSIYGNGPLAYTAGPSDYGDAAEANARLIAAAPMMLDALKECVSELEGVGWGGAGYTDLAHAAIAAATGVPCNPELLSPAATADKATGNEEVTA